MGCLNKHTWHVIQCAQDNMPQNIALFLSLTEVFKFQNIFPPCSMSICLLVFPSLIQSSLVPTFFTHYLQVVPSTAPLKLEDCDPRSSKFQKTIWSHGNSKIQGLAQHFKTLQTYKNKLEKVLIKSCFPVHSQSSPVTFLVVSSSENRPISQWVWLEWISHVGDTAPDQALLYFLNSRDLLQFSSHLSSVYLFLEGGRWFLVDFFLY